MVDKIEMSLDDIIKSTKRPQRGGAAGGKRGRGGPRRGGGRPSRVDSSPRKTRGGGVVKGRRAGGIQKAKYARGDVNSAWKHDMYDGPRRAAIQKALGNEPAKLIVSNLDFGVSDSDIRELFTEFGAMKKAAVHYDRSGRSLGSADVVFERRADALKAIKQYNGVPLDGRPMKIQLATSDVTTLTRTRRPDVRVGGGGPSPSRGRPAPRRGGAGGGVRRGGNAGRNRGGGGRGGSRNQTKPTAEELDAELDAYVNDMKA